MNNTLDLYHVQCWTFYVIRTQKYVKGICWPNYDWQKKIGAQRSAYISEYFYHVEEWPAYAIEILFGKQFFYLDRMKLAAFFYGNGLREGHIAGNIFKIYNKHYSNTLLWNKRSESFEKIIDYYTNHPTAKFNYFYYDMHNNCNLYLNGEKKQWNGIYKLSISPISDK